VAGPSKEGIMKSSMAPKMVELLVLRKEAVEGQIAERHRQARENGTTADVKQLSAILRAVKRQIAKARGDGQS
jgi:hypothetical protein